jgi:hypothetical protein
LLVKMTSFQRKLYDTFMNDVIRSKKVQNPLKAFAVCCKIWNHPDVLYNFLKKKEELDLEIELEENERAEFKKRKMENAQVYNETTNSSISSGSFSSTSNNHVSLN